jgi:S-formylglutathione hydrolase FrmB
MALIECHFFSEVLGLSTAMTVILPQSTTAGDLARATPGARRRHPVLFLLHGLSDDHTIWLRRTSIERYVAPLGLAVVMPAVHRSFYANMKQGENYWTFVSEEVPRLAREFFPLSEAREDNFVAGLSMGGHGAFKLALNLPERFCAAASLSGALWFDPDAMFDEEANKHAALFRRIFGSRDEFVGTRDDLPHAVRQLARSGRPRPRLFQCCGTEDFLYDQNVRFRRLTEPLGFDYTYEEEPGAHEWGYWDRKIQRVLEWLVPRGGAQRE